MLRLTIFISLFLFQMAHAQKVEEAFIVKGKFLLKEIVKSPQLTVDHIEDDHFELYGPKGTKTWLEQIGADFTQMPLQFVNKNFDRGYPSFEKVEKNLKRMVELNPGIAKLISIGKSVEGRDLWVVKISDNVEIDELEPEFKYISSMHGNEITGRELTQYFIEDLIKEYGQDPLVTSLINNTEIYIMPSMNPDGSERRQRANANGYDLNRNFPDWKRGDVNTDKNRQPETRSIMKFQDKRNFALSANYHGGALVVNYPWDTSHDPHPHDELVQYLSLKYANLNTPMSQSRSFNRGITNGADWYVLKGGMQDWSYFWHNDLQITIEVSRKKWPSYSSLPEFYTQNKQSMLAYLEAIHQGFGIRLANSKSGRVKIYAYTDQGKEIVGSYGFQRGEFYKVLGPGNYQVIVEEEGSLTQSKIEVQVDAAIQPNGNYYSLN